MYIIFSIIFILSIAAGAAFGYINDMTVFGYIVSLAVSGFIGSSIIAVVFSGVECSETVCVLVPRQINLSLSASVTSISNVP